MKKGVLASSALALGVGSGVSAGESASLQQEANEALVFAYDYRPNTSFEVINRLQQDAVDEILGREIGGSEVVNDPSDYRGYIVLYSMNGGDNPGEYAMVFVEDSTLDTGSEYEFTQDAVFFNTDANLLEVELD